MDRAADMSSVEEPRMLCFFAVMYILGRRVAGNKGRHSCLPHHHRCGELPDGAPGPVSSSVLLSASSIPSTVVYCVWFPL